MPDRQLATNYISLKPNETKNYRTDMSGGGTDGAYFIEYRIGVLPKSKMLGYYSNGASIEKLIEIYFEGDTIRIKNTF
jgi:hypothetical protein